MLWIIRFFDIMITLWWLRDGCLQKIPDGDSQFSFSPLPHTPVTGVIHNDSLLIAKLKELWKVWKKKQHCHSKKRPLKVTFKSLFHKVYSWKYIDLSNLMVYWIWKGDFYCKKRPNRDQFWSKGPLKKPWSLKRDLSGNAEENSKEKRDKKIRNSWYFLNTLHFWINQFSNLILEGIPYFEIVWSHHWWNPLKLEYV